MCVWFYGFVSANVSKDPAWDKGRLFERTSCCESNLLLDHTHTLTHSHTHTHTHSHTHTHTPTHTHTHTLTLSDTYTYTCSSDRWTLNLTTCMWKQGSVSSDSFRVCSPELRVMCIWDPCGGCPQGHRTVITRFSALKSLNRHRQKNHKSTTSNQGRRYCLPPSK